MLKKASQTVGCLLVALTVAACGGGGKDPLDHALDFALEGTFADIDGLAAEFDGESNVTAVDFGDSVMGTNSSVFAKGDALVNDIECGEDSCTGQVVVPHVDENGVLQSISRETATFTKDGENVVVTSPSLGERIFTPWTPPEPGPSDLKTDAPCEEWWKALVAGGTWKITYSKTGSQDEPSDVEGLAYTFTEPLRWEMQGDPGKLGSTVQGGIVQLADNFLESGKCRVYLLHETFGWGTPLFAYSLSGGTMVLHYSTGTAEPGEDEIRLTAQ